jgi:(p)ppGpp synthase/HD superfamily hydrolase
MNELQTDPEKFKSNDNHTSIVYNTLANARAINATARKLGLPPIFHFSINENDSKSLREIVNFENIEMDENAKVLTNSLLSDFETRSAQEKKKLIEALELALELHADQKPRPDGPYVNHILRVAEQITNYLEIKDAEVLSAALLHDSLEDQYEKLSVMLDSLNERTREKALEYIQQKFGNETTRILLAVTNPEELGSLATEERNKRYIEHIVTGIVDPKVFYVKLSDFCDNGLNIETVPNKDRQKKLARKYLPLYQIFIDRLQEKDMQIPDHKKEEITARLVAVKAFAEKITR